jgi:surfeit locus 1 family protein
MTTTTSRRRGVIAVLVVACLAAAACIRLGVWQLTRLEARQAYNKTLIDRTAGARIAAESLPADTAEGHYRLVTARGSMRYDREIVWAPRMRQGSPGVNFFTPMRLAGTDTVIIINRGWAYSPDAKSATFERWRERDTLSVAGYVETWTQDCGYEPGRPLPPSCGDSTARVLRRLDRRAAERLVGAPVASYILMQTSDSTLRADSIPARVTIPMLDEGPHRGYALQWFGFAMVSLIGGGLLARRTATKA